MESLKREFLHLLETLPEGNNKEVLYKELILTVIRHGIAFDICVVIGGRVEDIIYAVDCKSINNLLTKQPAALCKIAEDVFFRLQAKGVNVDILKIQEALLGSKLVNELLVL